MPLPQLLLTLRDEAAEGSFEYMLVLGGAAVLIMAALVVAFPPVVHALLALACPTIDPAAAGGASCLGS